MKVNTDNTKAIFEFSPDTHYLVLNDSRRMGKEWSLNERIDRSEKGKDDDIGGVVLYLSDEEAEECKKLGFSWIEL